MATVPLVDQAVFSVGAEVFSWQDVLVASILWGDWCAIEQEVRDGIACLHELETASAPPEYGAMLERAATEFRYERSLIAVDDLAAWCEAVGLTQDQWLDYMRRCVLRGLWRDRVDALVADHAPDAGEIRCAMWATMVCGGHAARLAHRLAAQAAVWDRLRGDGMELDERADVALAAEIDAELRGHATGQPLDDVKALGVVRAEERARAIARLDVGLRRFREHRLTPAVVAQEIALHRLDWIRIDTRVLALPSEAAAMEASLCLREDGLALDEVARSAGVVPAARRSLLEELPGAMRDQFLAARAGDLIGPLREDGQFVLHDVMEKHLPGPDDREVRERAERDALGRLLAREVNDRVRWRVHV